MLKIGTKAPEFTLKDQDNIEHTLTHHLKAGTNGAPASKFILVYFYPKDDTPGCTKEACVIRDAYKDFEANGVKVFGISKDSPESHKKFAEKYELPFTLLSDPSKETMKAYGAIRESGWFRGGTARVSYLIGKDGKIVKVYPKVDPASHAGEILKDILELEK
jgi:peroxiredoxin Q/BCP